MGNHDSIKRIISKFSGQANQIVIPKIYLDLLDGDYPAAALLNQIVYWSDRAKIPGGWFYHSNLEWLDELCLTYFQVKRSTKRLLDNQWIECHVRRANGYPTTHYRVVMENLTNSILKFLEIRETLNSRNLNPVFQETLKTEIQETLKTEIQETLKTEIEETRISLTEIKPEIKPKIKTEITANPPHPPRSQDNGGGGGDPFYDDLINLGIHKNEIFKLKTLAKSHDWTSEEVYNEFSMIIHDKTVTKPIQVLLYRIKNNAPSPIIKFTTDDHDPSKFLKSEYGAFFKTGKE
jgi:hypothetical protein